MTTSAIIWTKELADATANLVLHHASEEVGSRAREIANGAEIGQPLSRMGVSFVQAMRSRFNPMGDSKSCLRETAFNLAWGEAWDAAQADAQAVTIEGPTVSDRYDATAPNGSVWAISHADVDGYGRPLPEARRYWAFLAQGESPPKLAGVIGFYAASLDEIREKLS